MANLRTVAQLLKLEMQGTFDMWEAERPLRIGWPHASTILQPESEWCLRRQVLLIQHPEEAERPEPKPWDNLKNMRNKHGWVIHEKYQKQLLKYGKVVYFQGEPELDLTHFDETRRVFYSTDGVTEYSRYIYIWEYKGYKQETWLTLDEAGDPPKDAHKQVNFYLHLTRDIYPNARGIIAVENKNTQELKMWCVEHNAEMARPYTQRCYDVKGAVATGSTPARVCVSCTEHRAEKCPVRKLCFSGKLKEKTA